MHEELVTYPRHLKLFDQGHPPLEEAKFYTGNFGPCLGKPGLPDWKGWQQAMPDRQTGDS